MKKRFWIIGLILVLAAAAGIAYRTLANNKTEAGEAVQTATVSIGSVESSITGVGTVRAKQSATINWGTSGKVSEVNASIGQQVEAEEILAALDQNSLSISIIQAQADLISAQADLDELKKPDPLKIAEAEKALVNAQEALEKLLHPTEADIAAAEMAVVTAQDALDDAQAVVDKLALGRGDAEDIELARADYLMAQDKVDQLQEMYEKTKGDPTEDARKALALSNLRAAETARARALGTLNWYLGTPTEAEISEANLELAVAQAGLATAQDALDRLRNPTEEDLALAEATVASAEESLADAQNGASEDDLTIAETRVTVAQATLDLAWLKAPFAGMITGIDVLTGDLVSQGTEAFKLSDMSKLLIDLSISEVDIQQIQAGQAATVTFDAITGKDYKGVVTLVELSPTISQGVVNYPVTVEVTNADKDIYPGMTAAVSITTQKSENVLVVPNSAIKTSAGQRTVTVLFEGQQISVPVIVGLVGDSQSEVSSDQLREGDTIVIAGSTTATSSSQSQFQQGPGFGGMIESIEIAPGGGPMP